MTIRLAVIGAGVMGEDHARIVAQELPGAVLQVVCDADAARAEQVAEAHGARDAANVPEEVVARGDVDAVILASPDPTHAPLSLACLAIDKPVLCEKPLSQSPDECREVLRAEAARGARGVMVGYMRRYETAYMEMRQALGAGTLGRALMMHNFHRNVATPYAAFTGAMAITNSAPHEFDIARHLLGTEITGISAWQPRRSDAVVAPVVMVLETRDAQLVTIEVNNNAAYGYDVRAELVGEAGSVSTTPLSYTRLDHGLAGAVRYDPDWRGRYAEAYRRQNQAFVRFARTGVFPETAADAWDGHCAAVVAEAGVQALAEGRRVAVDPGPRPDLYG